VTPLAWGILVLVIVGGELLVVSMLLRAGLGKPFAALAAQFPAVEPATDAVERRFQSFRFGLINAGFSVHVAVDSAHLHLRPVRLLRWLGAKAVSVPWDAVEVKPGRGAWRSARVGSLRLTGPAWALDLASPPTPPDASDTL